ncbi:MAG: DUF4870 domain-containing protein [Candidatus Tectomicrobia bacterium]|nr:DUF4870 domain-containing protein [Candidatus Tectomicrobia bacterium]
MAEAEATTRERKFGAVAHMGAKVGELIPFVGGFLVPLAVWWWQRDSLFVVRHARASINFQLSMTLYYGIALGYVFVSVLFGLVLLVSLMAFEWVSMVKAARRAEAGGYYRYRMCLTFLKDEVGCAGAGDQPR